MVSLLLALVVRLPGESCGIHAIEFLNKLCSHVNGLILDYARRGILEIEQETNIPLLRKRLQTRGEFLNDRIFRSI